MNYKSSLLATYLAMTMQANPEQTNAGNGAEAANKEPPVPAGHKRFPFHFRTEKIRNEVNEVIGEGKKHPTIFADLPVPTDQDLIEYIAANGKEAQFLREVVYEAIATAARDQINEWRLDNKDTTPTAGILDLPKLTFTAIANTPPKDRAAPEIPEEVWNSFYEDYKKVIVDTGKEPVRVQKHIVLFKAQFRTCKFDKPALSVLRDMLNLWAAKTENMEDNKEAYEVLSNKVDKYLKAEEKNLVNAL